MSSARKDQHVDLALSQHGGPTAANEFDLVEFVHHALGALTPQEVDLTTELFDGAPWAAPLYVNGMTGGSAKTGEINRSLAIAARHTGLPIASGSMSVALRHPELLDTFRVIRKENPDGFVMANLGPDHTPDSARRVVDILEANALQIHLNAVQETVMPEGSRDFSDWIRSLSAMVQAVDVPVIVKEVGFGLSRRTLLQLRDLGVKVADVSGRGGTDFVRIENARRPGHDFDYLVGWGQSAVCCLLDAPADGPDLVASGGVRTPLDVVRALALGAKAVGVSASFLTVAVDGGPEALIAKIERWLDQIRHLAALLGAARGEELTQTDVLLRGTVREFCELRGIDPAAFSARSWQGDPR